MSAAVPPPPFPARRLELALDPAAVPRDWYAGDPHLSAFWEALSLLFPEGERFFVESVRAFRDQVTDPVLAADVVGFAAQEAMHGTGHRAFNDLIAARDPAAVERIDRQLRGLLGLARRVLSPRSRLAVTCALEHFTAILAEQLLGRADHRGAIAHAELRALWLWHSLEETEHKTVAFDVYVATGGGTVRRLAIMLLTTVIFVAEVANVHVRLLRTRRALWSPRRWLGAIGYFWLRPGLFRSLILPYLAYFRPGFHPSDRDTAALVDDWRDRLFGADGELRDQVEVRWPGRAAAAVAADAA